MVDFTKVAEEVRKESAAVALTAVSKTKSLEDIMEAYMQGARVFGENRVQEICEKFSSGRPSDMKVYLIGQLQSNKVKKAVSLVDRIESVDSSNRAENKGKEAEKIAKSSELLVESNSSGGRFSLSLSHVKLLGLMTVGPLGHDEEKNREAFLKTRRLFDSLKPIYGFSVLSMGMSGDWKTAIECGSTEVRIGTAIFGGRS